MQLNDVLTHRPEVCDNGDLASDGRVCEITPEMISAFREKLDEWAAFGTDYGATGPDDVVISWGLEKALRKAGFAVQNPLGPEPVD